MSRTHPAKVRRIAKASGSIPLKRADPIYPDLLAMIGDPMFSIIGELSHKDIQRTCSVHPKMNAWCKKNKDAIYTFLLERDFNIAPQVIPKRWWMSPAFIYDQLKYGDKLEFMSMLIKRADGDLYRFAREIGALLTPEDVTHTKHYNYIVLTTLMRSSPEMFDMFLSENRPPRTTQGLEFLNYYIKQSFILAMQENKPEIIWILLNHLRRIRNVLVDYFPIPLEAHKFAMRHNYDDLRREIELAAAEGIFDL